MLTWLLAADTVHSLPKPEGTLAEKILEETATQPAAAFKTQYPPSNSERLLIPETQPVSRMIEQWVVSGAMFTWNDRSTVLR